MRKAGVLMPVSALPSRIGAGELGESAFQFIELLKENHVKIWQILPLNPVGYGNSPYQPYSSCAGDELYISLDALAEEGLLKEHPKEFQERATRVDYEAVRQYREPFLRTAFDVFTEKKGQEETAYKEFASQENAGMTGRKNIEPGRRTDRSYRQRWRQRHSIRCFFSIFSTHSG